MASSGSPPLLIDPEIGECLERRASLEQTSASSIAERAIAAAYLRANETKDEAIREAIREADKGVYISREAIERWMRSWDTDDELPPPEPDVFLQPR